MKCARCEETILDEEWGASDETGDYHLWCWDSLQFETENAIDAF